MKIPKYVIQRVSGRAVNATRTDTVTGNHTFTMDEPVARHGNDEGMLPLQALMCSLAGCTNVVANWIANDLGIEIRDMSFEIAGKLDTRSITGAERVDPPFPEIDFAVEVTTTGTEAQIDELREQLRWRCPVAATFNLAGTKINERWTVHKVEG
jgi:uncharacterized OsmC-like protein